MTRTTKSLLCGFISAAIVVSGGCSGIGIRDRDEDKPLIEFVSSAESTTTEPTGDQVDRPNDTPVRIPSAQGTPSSKSSPPPNHVPLREPSQHPAPPSEPRSSEPRSSEPPSTEPLSNQPPSGEQPQSQPPQNQLRPGEPATGPVTLDAWSPANRPHLTPTAQAGVSPQGLPPANQLAMPTGPARDRDYPIDLANALAMGGANHLQIQIARQRVLEAHANWIRAAAIWIPSLRFGVAWTRHDGQIQATEGRVVDVARSSLFVGGGAGVGEFPLTGGAGGPARLMVNLSLADAIFERPVAERQLAAASANEGATVNDSLRDIAVAYFSLVEAYSRVSNAAVGLKLSSDMVKLTTLFEQKGAGSQAAVDVAKAEEAFWRQAVQEAERLAFARAAELARLIRIDPQMQIVPADESIVPIHLTDPNVPLEHLVATGLAARPEVAQQQALVAAAHHRSRQEHWRPLLPNVHVGASAGTFGGGRGSDFNNQATRSDVDLLAVWELQNSGFGVFAQRRMRASQLAQAMIQTDWLRDQIVTEIVTASNDVSNYQRQIETAMQSVEAGRQSYERNYQRVRAGEGLPIELLQAIRATANALDSHTRAVGDFNRAQARLLRAIGRPVDGLQPDQSDEPLPGPNPPHETDEAPAAAEGLEASNWQTRFR